jgi:hypothetical protein
VRDNLFFVLEHENSTNVIGCLNVETRQFNVLDFSSRLPIFSIAGFDQGNIIVHTNKRNSKKHHIYKIPFG